MAVRKICKPKGCRGSPRCDHPWWFDVMCQGRRWRMRVNDFAALRGAKELVTSKQAAERVWEPKFVGEIMAGRDPRIAPVPDSVGESLKVADLRHEGACRLLADGVDIRTIQLVLGHADIKQTQRHLNITDEELRKSMTGVWERRRQLRLAGQQSRPEASGDLAVGQ